MQLKPWHEYDNAPPPGTRLGRLDELADGSARGVEYAGEGAPFRMFLVRRGDRVWGYVNLCPHHKLPLNGRTHDFVDRTGSIRCANHFARFRFADGRCFDGVCKGEYLAPIPIHSDGETLRIDGHSNA